MFVAASGAVINGFEGNDGNLVVDTSGNTDWASFPINCATGTGCSLDTPSGSSDNSFTQGTHEDDPNVTIATGSIPPNKNDLTRSYMWSTVNGGKNYLYLAWERLVNTGSANIDFELDQNSTSGWTSSTTGPVTINRTEGDLLVTYDFGGSGTPDIGVLTWLTSSNPANSSSDCEASGAKLPCWGDRVDATASGFAEAAVNSAPVTDQFLSSTPNNVDTGLFGEAAINLSDIPGGPFSQNTCKAFGTEFVKSRSSGSSIDSELKDFIAPGPIHISNCGSLTVKKQTVGGTGSFSFTGGGPNGISLPSGFSAFNLDTSSNNPAGRSFDGFEPGHTYTVGEGSLPAGWSFSGATCVDDATHGQVGTLNGQQESISLDVNQSVTCTFTNTKQPTLTVNKILVPAQDAGMFNLQIDGNTAGTGANVGDGGTTGVVVVGVGSHNVGETAGTGTDLGKYASTIGGDCAANGSVTLAAGENKVCTITNRRKPTLTVTKTVVPANDPGKFNLQIDGQTAGTGANVGDGGSTGPVIEDVGSDHTVGEAAGTSTSLAGYLQVIGGDCATDGTVHLNAGDNKVCTITNTRKATIIVKKHMIGGTATFAFTGHPAGSIGQDNGTIQETVAPGQQYVATETPTAGWDLTSITCDNANGTGNLVAGTATFNPTAGQTITCTYTNTKQATITVKKVTDPAGAQQSFGFSGDITASLSDGQSANSSVAPGTYHVTEAATAGWDLTDISCDNANSSGNKATGVATFVVTAGQHVTCTYTNTKQATITVKKVTDPAGAQQSFGFSGDITASLSDGQSANSSVAPGTYHVTEAATAGWDLTDISCDNANSSGNKATGVATFVVTAGQHVTCTYTNTKQATITVKKVTDPAGAQQSFGFSGDITASLSDGQSANSSVAPGTYHVTEAATAGWDLTDISCDNANSSGNKATGVATFVVTAGQHVTCTYTNTKQATITVKKVTDPAGAQQSFGFSGDITASLSDGQSANSSVAPGTYHVTEAATAGWDLTDISCDNANSSGNKATGVATFVVTAGQHVTCTYTNTKQATITVKKVTDPAGAQQSFGFSGDITASLSDGQSANSSVAPGTYHVTEAATAGWDLTDISCDNANSSGNTATGVATFVVTAGQHVTCTYTNTKVGSITVVKTAVGGNDSFSFTTSTNLAPAALRSPDRQRHGAEGLQRPPAGHVHRDGERHARLEVHEPQLHRPERGLDERSDGDDRSGRR